MKHFTYLMIFFVLFSICKLNGQNANWNDNYRITDVTHLITYEKTYSDSVDKGLIAGMTYSSMRPIRFVANYTGEKRKITPQTKSRMKGVYKFWGDKRFLSLFDQIESEYEFSINNQIFWFAIQSKLEKDFKREVKRNKNVVLYCLFLNCHPRKGELVNNFLISEFNADVNELEKYNSEIIDWVRLETNLDSKLSKTECMELLNSNNLRYVHPSGDTAYVKIENGYWNELQEKGKYHNENKLILKGDCNFELEYIESTNPDEKRSSKKGEKIAFRIIEKKNNYYLLTAEKNRDAFLFRMFYK